MSVLTEQNGLDGQASSSVSAVRVRQFMVMGTILEELGHDAEAILEKTGLPRDLFTSPNEVISYREFDRLVTATLQTTSLADLGFLVGRRESLSHLGLAGLVARHKPTVGEAWSTIVASHRISETGGVPDVQVAEAGTICFTYDIIANDIQCADYMTEAGVAFAVKIMRELCGESWKPLEVHFRRTPQDLRAFQAFFRCTIVPRSTAARMIFPVGDLDLPVVGRDAVAHDILAPLLDAEMRNARDYLTISVRSVIASLMTRGAVSQERVARTFGMSSRSFSRRLRERGISFSSISEEVRFERAKRLLMSDKAIGDIAHDLGYSDTSAFIRAFRHWCGTSPHRWRADRGPTPVVLNGHDPQHIG